MSGRRMTRLISSLSGVLALLLVGTVACSDEGVVSGSAGAGGALAGGGANAGGAAVSGSAASPATSGGGGPALVAGEGGGGTSLSGGVASAGGGGSGGSGGKVGSGGAASSAPSLGCNKPAAQALAIWEEQPMLSVNDKPRQWWVWLPTGYDPSRAYPLIFTFHGCGGPNNFIPIQKATGSDAIVVRGTGGDNGCWTYGLEGDDVKFFDAMLTTLQDSYCVDTSRVFSMGYSSGAWMTNTLECSRGDKLRATGTLSGGRAHDGMNCKGKFARSTVHDLDDPTNPFDEQGADKELARVLAQNHCKTESPLPEYPSPCAQYQGCDAGFPVIACRTQGKGHDRQDALAMEAFWKLFESL